MSFICDCPHQVIQGKNKHAIHTPLTHQNSMILCMCCTYTLELICTYVLCTLYNMNTSTPLHFHDNKHTDTPLIKARHFPWVGTVVSWSPTCSSGPLRSLIATSPPPSTSPFLPTLHSLSCRESVLLLIYLLYFIHSKHNT